jgi:superfamily II DNA or RNA helicase
MNKQINNDSLIKQDLAEISKNKLNAKVKTETGKKHLMLLFLEHYINNGETDNIKKIYYNLKKPENKLSFEFTTQYSDILIKMEQLVGKKDDKGFWEYSIFQKVIIPNQEQNIKSGLKPDNSLDLKKINQYINPQLSREEQIEQNFNSGIKLSKVDTIIYNKYIEKKQEDLQKDINEIQRIGVKATPSTNEGKIHYIMYLLENFIKNEQIDNIANIYLKLQDPKYKLTTELSDKYMDLINKMNNIVSKLNMIDLQFTKFYNQMPPLNEKGFVKFDEWQVNVINNVDNNISTIISAPTSAGKSVISGYVTTKGRSLYVVPTDALAWQVASYIGGIMDSDIPIITTTYQSIPKRDQFIQLLNNAKAIVGTSETILDYLPFIKCNFKWVIFDEIHMMGKKEGSAIETIAKILCDIPFIGLSATIGNIDELRDWFSQLSNNPIETIICDKRFLNLQKYFYDTNNNELTIVHPLSLISYSEFSDRSILNKTLNQTPKDTWSFVNKLLSHNIDLGDLNPYIYFKQTEVIKLTQTYIYFNELIKFMVDNYILYEEQLKLILTEYSSFNFNNYDTNLIKLLDTFKKDDKFPAIIFQQNTISCLEIVRKLAEDLENAEIVKYPNLRKERINADKNVKKLNKKIEKELNTLTEKQIDKKMKDQKDFVFDLAVEHDINAPHPDFVYNIDSQLSDNEIKECAEKYKIYFPYMNGDYHYLIKLLWRGIGVYTCGLPDDYLRLIQKLASKKKLSVVFSDSSLVFGISMPFRSSVIFKNNSCNDNLDAMMYHQMAGRAGRRGLDKDGNVIFVGYSWDRIKELSISSIPLIGSSDKLLWSCHHANIMSSNNNYLQLNMNRFKSNYTIDYINNFNSELETNYNNQWQFCTERDKNLIQLMWMFRYSNEGVIITFLLPYLKKYFELCNPYDENKQIEMAYFLSKFIDIKQPDNQEDILQELKSSKIIYTPIYYELNNINIDIPEHVDNKIWLSIRNNCLVDIKNDELRQRLFDFSTKLKAIQHYCYHTKQINVTKVLGKLLTRIWWIYHTSSPVIRTSIDQNIDNMFN